MYVHEWFNQLSAVQAGNLTENEVRQMVKPLFYTRMRLGEWIFHDCTTTI